MRMTASYHIIRETRASALIHLRAGEPPLGTCSTPSSPSSAHRVVNVPARDITAERQQTPWEGDKDAEDHDQQLNAVRLSDAVDVERSGAQPLTYV